MAYIPKSAQRKILAAARSSAARTAIATTGSAAPPGAHVPTRLALGEDHPSKCAMYDVFFNGVRQLSCRVADVNAGYIIRYTKSIGRRALSDETEQLFGDVVIKPRKR